MDFPRLPSSFEDEVVRTDKKLLSWAKWFANPITMFPVHCAWA
ncbi:hypothetical protein BQ8482_111013 [Mesorhizobium delmotii]|uniref:Uncharacterized protein n=1 Tax=Mesorhizobium delmotii TaxID=1631247 RepID=A0A2P9AD76_9HYPH|nr:hypothetical protein BQ8482_111013 [Mesorhizobium delmotii]